MVKCGWCGDWEKYIVRCGWCRGEEGRGVWRVGAGI